jgi:hypothetical protein
MNTSAKHDVTISNKEKNGIRHLYIFFQDQTKKKILINKIK